MRKINFFTHFKSIPIAVFLLVIAYLFKAFFVVSLLIVVSASILFLIELKKAYKLSNNKLYLNLYRSGLTSLTILFLAFLIVEAILLYNIKNPEPFEDEEIDAVIVLGAGLHGKAIPATLLYRLDTAVEYLKKNKKVPVIVSGGQGPGEDLTEAEAMKIYMISQGIDQSRIYMEGKSTSTIENLTLSQQLLKNELKLNDPTVLIISSNYHITRALMISEAIDLKAYAQGSRAYAFKNYIIREFFGLVDTYIKLKRNAMQYDKAAPVNFRL